jgi:CheY-like chemotaxis protein/GNAT superfamily N-acetyltransferase
MGRVLVVDDSRTARMKISKAVQVLGHEAVAVADAEEALVRLGEGRFDTVLLDVLMPGMDGFAALARIKAEPRTRDIPVIMVSALSGTLASVVRAMDLGAEDFLPKRFDLDLLKARLNASVERSLRRGPAQPVKIRAARDEDIPMLLGLINTAAAGLPLAEWRAASRPGQSPWDRGRDVLMDQGCPYHLGNCWVAQNEGGGYGLLVLHPAGLEPGPDQTTPDFKRPLLDLEQDAAAAETAHVSILCTMDGTRGQGIGSALLSYAASRQGPRGLSLIVASSNWGARALYLRHGYADVARRPMILADGRPNGHDWVLMIRPTAGRA